MKSSIIIAFSTLGCTGALLLLSSPATSQTAGSFVALQADFPGTSQAGNANIAGTMTAMEGLFASSSTTNAAVYGLSNVGDSGLGGYFSAPYGVYSAGIFAESSGNGVFARRGLGSGWQNIGFPEAAIVGDGDAFGVTGKAGSTGASGVIGNCYDGNSITYFPGSGVSGISYGRNWGVAGQATTAIAGYVGTQTFGVQGINATNGSGINNGYLGGSSDAVYGDSGSPEGNGVHGTANNGSAAYGIWGSSSSGYAGVFSGTTSVAGNFYASAKFFRIDHPLDPVNKYLIHSCVESDEQLNIYRGNAKCDARGEAWVELPGYFGALNKDPSYQLTCIGGHANVFVAKESSNGFRIGGGKPGLKVSWMVSGSRNDPYAKAHPMTVEVEKPGHERGKLWTPTEYKYPVEMGMTFEKEQAAEAIPKQTTTGVITIRK